MMSSRYEVLPHTADTAIVARGSSLEELFENAAFGMFDLMFDLGALTGSQQVTVEASAETVEEVLVDWLSALLYESEVGDLALCSFNVDFVEGGRVKGSAGGAPVTQVELRGPPVKAVTYHELAVERSTEGWLARVVFDV